MDGTKKATESGALWRAALYARLSREDGDRAESDSIANQRDLLQSYAASLPETEVFDIYTDDGFTGTNFARPAFERMLADIETGQVNCVIVKDLSRFGRDYIDAGRYLERWLPSHGVRFIAVNDHIDSERGAYDMMMPLKNLFNAQYAKDISLKVKSAFAQKQRSGKFIGAFACYGYLKDPEDHNHLIIDPVAAQVVKRVFSLFDSGEGKVRIAKELNREKVPCPSEYKRLMGERYRNANRIENMVYWTYSTVHKMLQNPMYTGNMVQGRTQRTTMHGQAKEREPEDWIVVEGTHEPIIPKEQWDRVQILLSRSAREPDFEKNVSPFAGFLKCGDCGRSMAKTTWSRRVFYTCGGYKRYGPTACTSHYITMETVEKIVLSDLNRIIASIRDLKELAERGEKQIRPEGRTQGETDRLKAALERVTRLKKGAYEDYRDKLLSRADFLQYKKDYGTQEEKLTAQLEQLRLDREKARNLWDMPWVRQLTDKGRLTELDRATVAETVKEIRVFEEGKIEITYLFSRELATLLGEDP